MSTGSREAAERTGLVLALGGGGARGLAHIGVIQVLEENAIPIRAIAGTSIGAEIGAFVASGMPINELAAIATSFDWKETLQLFMPDLPTGGLVSGVNIEDFLQSWIGAHRIEDLEMGYVAIATDIETRAQVVLDSGSLVAAVRASISVPGLIAPYRYDHRRRRGESAAIRCGARPLRRPGGGRGGTRQRHTGTARAAALPAVAGAHASTARPAVDGARAGHACMARRADRQSR